MTVMEAEKITGMDVGMILVREFDPAKDVKAVEEVEKICEAGPSGKLTLFTDLLGDPLCRIRHSPAFLMLVAELVVEVGVDGTVTRTEIVGMIRGCIKSVTCGKKFPRNTKTTTNHTAPLPIFTKVAYTLGLRVSPSHRRLGIGAKLVTTLEQWYHSNGVEYSYLATEEDNTASLHLFTNKLGYTKFRTPSLLVQPVFAHSIHISSSITIIKLSPLESETLYRTRFSTTEFFPRDIDSILNNKLSLGTFLAVPRSYIWPGSITKFLTTHQPESWGVVSIWNCMDLWRLQVKGASGLTKGLAWTTRVMDKALPWLKLPSVPQVFTPFGLHFMYGLGGHGPLMVKMVRALCGYAHNLARREGCGVIATEVASQDPVKEGVPHWKKLSCEADQWCIKRLGEDYSDGSVGDWTKSPPGLSIFVDPREF